MRSSLPFSCLWWGRRFSRQSIAAGMALLCALIFVLALDEAQRAGLVAAFWRAVEDHERAERFFAAAGIVGIGMVDGAVLVLEEGAEAGQLVMGIFRGRLAVIVHDLAARQLLLGEGDVIVEVEVAAMGRKPW